MLYIYTYYLYIGPVPRGLLGDVAADSYGGAVHVAAVRLGPPLPHRPTRAAAGGFFLDAGQALFALPGAGAGARMYTHIHICHIYA